MSEILNLNETSPEELAKAFFTKLVEKYPVRDSLMKMGTNQLITFLKSEINRFRQENPTLADDTIFSSFISSFSQRLSESMLNWQSNEVFFRKGKDASGKLKTGEYSGISALEIPTLLQQELLGKTA